MPPHSVLFTSRAPIGYVAITKNEVCTNQGFKSIVPNANTDYLFLYYLLVHNRDRIENMGSGTTFKEISGSVMKGITVSVPIDIKEQEAISKILGSLDDKIEDNKRINQHLEQMAQAIFKSWFVDFEPWGGVVPNDWKKTQFGEISTIQNGYAFKSEDYCDDGCRMIRTTNICDGYVNNDDLINLPKSFYSDCKYKNFIFKCFDTVLVMVGASVGKIGLITKKNIPSLQNQNMWRFRPKKDNISVLYVHYYTKLINDSVRSWSNGSAREFYRKDIFKKAPCFLPTDSIMSDFNLKTLHLFEKISNNLEENEKLAEIRDTLLPKLLSGEIRIPEAEKIVEEIK